MIPLIFSIISTIFCAAFMSVEAMESVLVLNQEQKNYLLALQIQAEESACAKTDDTSSTNASESTVATPGEIKSIKITDEMLDAKVFPIDSNIMSLISIDLSDTKITDKQLATILNAINRNKILELHLCRCKNLNKFNLCDLPSLSDLDLTGCNLDSINLGNLPRLEYLDLSDANITGAILTNILNQGNLRKTLRTLIIGHCKNTIKDINLGNLPGLTCLDFYCSDIDNINLGNLASLESLNLSGTNITDIIFNDILNQSNLRKTLRKIYVDGLNLAGCDLDGFIWSCKGLCLIAQAH
jgi:uncharacterized protein YjbI with pentapeptide repeats